MLTCALHVHIEAKPEKADTVARFLTQALALARAEATTPAWFALRTGPASFGIFDAFEHEGARQAHLAGPIAAALMANADDWLSTPPVIERVELLAAKLPA